MALSIWCLFVYIPYIGKWKVLCKQWANRKASGNYFHTLYRLINLKRSPQKRKHCHRSSEIAEGLTSNRVQFLLCKRPAGLIIEVSLWRLHIWSGRVWKKHFSSGFAWSLGCMFLTSEKPVFCKNIAKGTSLQTLNVQISIEWFYSPSFAGWQKLCEGTKGLRRKVWIWTKILSPNMRFLSRNNKINNTSNS